MVKGEARVLFSFLFLLYISFIQIDELPEINAINITTENEEQMNHASSLQKTISTIIEVEGNPEEHKNYIRTYFPTIEVVATYDKLFYGLALRGRADRISKLTDLQFVKGIYPVQTYTSLEQSNLLQTYPSLQLINAMDNKPMNQGKFHHHTFMQIEDVKQLNDLRKLHPNIVIPHDLNKTSFTGKGIKVGVVDTGVDFNHPDLKSNYRGGYDLVDLDDEPMETTEEQGVPTNHGTHVAGIIAANGTLKGVAPDAEIYAYRALGPGGFGTSIQVIAAMEEAVKDGVDIINLSLGNTINGPDYPTSRAVNEAVNLGVAVVVANGNSGPTDWTIGAPATAPYAFSVGAFQQSGFVPFLYEPKHRKTIQLSPLSFSSPWTFTRDYQIANKETEKVRNKLGLFKQENKSLAKSLKKFEEDGGLAAIIYGITPDNQQWLFTLREESITIPLAIVSNSDGRWINKTIERDENLYFKNNQEQSNDTIARFSSRGPVTVNWMLKPDVIAPGVNVLSTVPGGYDMLNGTSMAAPHVAGAIAVVKEARPNWSNEQIIGALKTTAIQIKTNKDENIAPTIQGAGLIDIEEAIATSTIIDNPLLSFGKITKHVDERTITMTIENVSKEPQTFYFDIPKKEKGISWHLPKTFTIEGMSKKEVPITLKVNTLQLEKRKYEDWLTLHNEQESFALPYLFISETSDYPRIMGFSFQISRADKNKYKYQFYAAEQIKSLEIKLYEPTSLVYEGTLLQLENLDVGMNEGEIRRDSIKLRGNFYGMIIVQLENGELLTYHTEIALE